MIFHGIDAWPLNSFLKKRNAAPLFLRLCIRISMTSLFWKQELELETDRIIRRAIGFFNVVIGLEPGIDCLITNFEKFTRTTADRHGPGI